MIPYIILLVLLPGVAIGSHFAFKDKKNGFLIYRLSVIIFTFLFVYVLGTFKSVSVGNDTEAYFAAYQRAQSVGWFKYNDIGFEIGFSMLMQIFSKAHAPFNLFLAFINIPMFAAFGLLIFKKSPYPLLSCILYICYSLLIFNLSGIRQSLAISIGIFGYLVLGWKSHIKSIVVFVLLLFLAGSIHSSAFILALLPLFKYVKIKKYALLSILLVVIIIFIFSDQFYGFVFYYVVGQRTYAPGSYGGGGVFVLLALFFIFMVLLSDENRLKDSINDVFERPFKRFSIIHSNSYHLFQTRDLKTLVALSLVCVITQAFCRVNVNFPRFGFYFLPFLFVALPQTIAGNRSRLFRLTVYSVICLFFVAYFLYTIIKGDTLNTVPYSFI